MTDDVSFGTRLHCIAYQTGFRIKRDSIAPVAKMIRANLDPDAAASAIARYLCDLRLSRPYHFEPLEAIEESAQ